MNKRAIVSPCKNIVSHCKNIFLQWDIIARLSILGISGHTYIFRNLKQHINEAKKHPSCPWYMNIVEVFLILGDCGNVASVANVPLFSYFLF